MVQNAIVKQRIGEGEMCIRDSAWVIKGLTARDHSRGLSTGERKMLHSARQMLISEIVLSKSLSYETVEEQLDTALA